MKYYPITLGVKRTNWSAKDGNAAHVADHQQASETVFQRDDHTCQCCGFKAKQWQKILHLNGNTNDFSDKNVLTTCIFCHQCFDLESVAEMESGMLIWLPEMSQADLNNLMRAVYVSRRAQGNINKLALKIIDMLYARGEEARRRLGSDSPEALALVMRDFLTTGEYRKAQKAIDGIRLLPLAKRTVPNPNPNEEGTTNEFALILGYWIMHVFKEAPPQNWTSMFQQADTLVS